MLFFVLSPASSRISSSPPIHGSLVVDCCGWKNCVPLFAFRLLLFFALRVEDLLHGKEILGTEAKIGFEVISFSPFVPRFDEYKPSLWISLLH